VYILFDVTLFDIQTTTTNLSLKRVCIDEKRSFEAI